MREGDTGRVEPLTVGSESNDDDGKYLAMLFSDLGDFPPLERMALEEPVEERPAEPAETAEGAGVEPPGAEEVEPADERDGAENGNGAGRRPDLAGRITVKPQLERPFIEAVLKAPTAPEMPPIPRRSRWRVAVLSLVGFLAVGGTGAAVLSLGYQRNARDDQATRAVENRAQGAQLTEAVLGGADLTSFQGCTTGEGLSPAGLMLVARAFVATTPPAVCLPAEEVRKKPARKTPATEKGPADQGAATTVVGTAPAGSSGSGGSTPTTGGGSGGTDPRTGTGTDPGTGTGGGDSGGDPTDGGGTTEPEKPGKGWGKGGKPKGGKT